jgi:hypothetical protein
MKVIFLMVFFMDMVYGVMKLKIMLVNGKKIKGMEKENINLLMVKYMKVNFKIIVDMVKGKVYILMVHLMMVIGKMI